MHYRTSQTELDPAEPATDSFVVRWLSSLAILLTSATLVGVPSNTVFTESWIAGLALPEIVFLSPSVTRLEPPFHSGIATGLMILTIELSLVSLLLTLGLRNPIHLVIASLGIGLLHGVGAWLTNLAVLGMVG